MSSLLCEAQHVCSCVGVIRDGWYLLRGVQNEPLALVVISTKGWRHLSLFCDPKISRLPTLSIAPHSRAGASFCPFIGYANTFPHPRRNASKIPLSERFLAWCSAQPCTMQGKCTLWRFTSELWHSIARQRGWHTLCVIRKGRGIDSGAIGWVCFTWNNEALRRAW